MAQSYPLVFDSLITLNQIVMKQILKIVSIILVINACENAEVEPDPSIEKCGYQNFGAQCELKVDTAGLHRDYWRFPNNCGHYLLSPHNLTIERTKEADYIYLENVEFMFTINYELRIKWGKELEPGLSIYHFSKYPDVEGCQIVCPQNSLIIIPKGQINNQGYEVVINAFCGRILLYGNL